MLSEKEEKMSSMQPCVFGPPQCKNTYAFEGPRQIRSHHPETTMKRCLVGPHWNTYDFEGPRQSRFHHPELLKVYAMVGLHRYNFLNGTNFEFHRLKKVLSFGMLSQEYFITFFAEDEGEQTAFQVLVCERECRALNIIVRMAQPVENPDDEFPTREYPFWENLDLPQWPSESDFKDAQRFYLLESSSPDWVLLYLHLALCNSDRYTQDQLNKIKILEVFIETSDEAVEERVKANNATLYIRYKDFDEAHREAVIVRDFDKTTGELRLRAESGITDEVVYARNHKSLAQLFGDKEFYLKDI